MLKGIQQCLLNVLSPAFVLEECFVQVLFQKLRALISAMAIIHSKPLNILLQDNRHLVLIILPIAAFMGNCSVPRHMRLKFGSNGFSKFWNLLLLWHCGGRRWCLTRHFQHHSTQSLRNQVGRHTVLGSLCGAQDLFQRLARSSWF